MLKRRTVFIIVICLVIMAVFAYSYIKAYNTSISKRFIEDDHEVSIEKTDIITDATVVVMEIFDVHTQAVHETEFDKDINLTGKSRSQLNEYIISLNDAITEDERSKGLLSYQLVYFSPDNVTIRKNYDTSVHACEYILKDINGYIVVYDYPENTVYHNTGILSLSLDSETQEELKSGIYIMDINELYDFLESYSS